MSDRRPTSEAPPPNHDAGDRPFAGLVDYLAGLTMIVGRGAEARLVAGMADLGSGHRVVDIGCGPGTAVRLAAADGIRLTGVDPAEPMLRLARLLTAIRRSPGEIAWRRAEAEDLGIPDSSVDVCWSVASIHHWTDLASGISEVRRVLKPDGRFIALERRSRRDATGQAAHGWTSDQAEAFAALLVDHGFRSSDVVNHDLGRRRVVTVAGRLA